MLKRAVNGKCNPDCRRATHKYMSPICRTACSEGLQEDWFLLLHKRGLGTKEKQQCLPWPWRCCWLDDLIDQRDILQSVPSSGRTQTDWWPWGLLEKLAAGWSLNVCTQHMWWGRQWDRSRKSLYRSVTWTASFWGCFLSLCGQYEQNYVLQRCQTGYLTSTEHPKMQNPFPLLLLLVRALEGGGCSKFLIRLEEK